MLTLALVLHNEVKNFKTLVPSLRSALANEIIRHILIIDNASNDSTLDLLTAEVTKDGPQGYGVGRWLEKVTCVTRQINHMSQARKMALDHCHTEWLLFFDGDCWGTDVTWNAWHDLLSTNLGKKNVYGGPASPSAETHDGFQYLLMTRGWLGHLKSAQAWRPSTLTQVEHLSTSQLAIPIGNLRQQAHLIEAHPEFQIVCEDVDLSFQLKRLGYCLLLLPQPQVKHLWDFSTWPWMKKMWRYGSGQWLVARRYPEWRLRACRGAMVGGYFLLAFFLLFIRPKMGLRLWGVYFVINFMYSLWAVWPWSKHRTRVFEIMTLLFKTHLAYGAGAVWGLRELVRKGPNEQTMSCNL